jgi:hypothetical protein
MNPSINAGALADAVKVMAEARQELAKSKTPGHYELATRLAIAEGRIAGALKFADIEIRSAA